MIRPRVVLALSPLTEREVEPLLFDPSNPPLDLLASVVEADELARAVQEQQRVDAVLLSPELSGLTPAHCERVRATGIRLVGLALDQRERELLDTLEVDTSLDSTVSREELLSAIRGDTTAGESRPVAAPPVTPAAERREDRRGSVLAVIGAKGAPGSSECAASLAALAARRWPTLLIEADALGGNLDAPPGRRPQQRVDPRRHPSDTGRRRRATRARGALDIRARRLARGSPRRARPTRADRPRAAGRNDTRARRARRPVPAGRVRCWVLDRGRPLGAPSPRSADRRRLGGRRPRSTRAPAARRAAPTRHHPHRAWHPSRAAADHRQRGRCDPHAARRARSQRRSPSTLPSATWQWTPGCRGTPAACGAPSGAASRSRSHAGEARSPARSRACWTSCSFPQRADAQTTQAPPHRAPRQHTERRGEEVVWQR